MAVKIFKTLGCVVLSAVITCTCFSTLAMADSHEHTFVEGICECGKYEVPFLTRIPIKEKYAKAIEETGVLETLDYTTPLYGIDESTEIEKHLQVYLPYGYDESNQYNVMYIMHGGGESEYYWLNDEPVYEGTKAMGKTTRAVIDNMIADGKMEPTIFVAPTYVTNDADGNDVTLSDMSGFAQEFRNVIVPFVESKYATYCNGDVSEGNLIATRDHRGFAGFSNGSRCAANGVFMRNLDLVSWFGFYSGPDPSMGGEGGATYEDACAAIERFSPDLDINYIYNGDGTSDFALEGHQTFAYGLLESMPDRFQNGKNWCWICFKGGSHAY
ncbi:MAG: hypothetical protein HUJ76_13295, partial [Parasporobacterium sp.]|nr:hypothetical protein [Parasporobacterium sp.]